MLEPTTISGPSVTRSTTAERIGDPAADRAVGEATRRRAMAAIVEAGVGAAAAAAVALQRQGLGAAHVGGVAAAEQHPRSGARDVVIGQPARRWRGAESLARSRGRSGLLDPPFMVAPQGGAANACRCAGACRARPGRAGNERHRQSSPGGAGGRRRPTGPGSFRSCRSSSEGGAERGTVDLAALPDRARAGTALVASAGGSGEAELAEARRDQRPAAAALEEPVHDAGQRPAPAAPDPRARRAAGARPLARPGVERLLRRQALQGAVRHHLPRRLRRAATASSSGATTRSWRAASG